MSRISVRQTIVLGIYLCISVSCFAQHAPTKHYAEKDGLPSATIYTIMNDSKGYLWLGTDAGVSRFDGHRFVNFTTSDGLADNEVVKIAEDSKGRIWLLDLSGKLSYYYHGVFYNDRNDPLLKKAQVNNTLFSFFEDQRRRLWFSGFGAYIMIDGDSVMKIQEETIIPGGIITDAGTTDVNILAAVRAGNPYNAGSFIYKDGRFYRHDAKYCKELPRKFCYINSRSVIFSVHDSLILQQDTVQTLLPLARIEGIGIRDMSFTSDSVLWVWGAGNGVFCYNMKNFNEVPAHYFEKMDVSDVVEDMEHNIWVSTRGDGIYMLHSGYRYVISYYTSDDACRLVNCVTKDTAGNIYTGHDHSMINMIKNERKPLLHPVSSVIKGIDGKVNKILIVGHELFVGTEYGLYSTSIYGNWHNRSFIEYVGYTLANEIRPISAVKDIDVANKRMLVCTPLRIVFADTVWDNKKVFQFLGASRMRFFSVHEDKQSVIWFGTGNGLYSFNGKEMSHADENSLLASGIYDIEEMPDSVLVLATYGNGVLLYKDGKILQQISQKDGLCCDLCKRLYVHNNIIYVATVNGASRLVYDHKHVDSIIKYTTADGLPSNIINDIYADDTDVCFATQTGLAVLDLKKYTRTAETPIVYISAVKCGKLALNPDSLYSLEHDQNSIQFAYTGINYSAPEGVVYQYRLGSDDSWIETKNMSVDITALQPGKYHFQLRARILNGAWSNVRSFVFIIAPPFWETYWFITVCALTFILLVIAIAVYIVRRRKLKDREQLKIKEQVAYLEQQALQAMMNPHFIFNVMNSIQHYINNNEKHEANLYLANFARLIRMNLDIASKRYIPVDEEVSYLQLYLALESLRFGQRLTYAIHVDPAIDGDETMVPVMLLQPFIENAIWHGILPKKGNGHVQIEIKKHTDSLLKVTITDNGIGMPGEKARNGAAIKMHTSHGMKMTRQRLDLIGNITGHTLYLQIQDAFPGTDSRGTKVEFLLPGDLK